MGIELEGLQSLFRSASPTTRSELGLFEEEAGDARIFGAEKLPSILLNRSIGLGITQPAGREQILEIHALYAKHGIQRYFLSVYPEHLAQGHATFDETPLVKARGWMEFKRDNSPAPRVETDLTITRIDKNDDEALRAYARIVCDAFGMPEQAQRLFVDLGQNEARYHFFLSYAKEEPVGAGGVFIFDGQAWFEGGATRPEFRGRGSQGAILAARIELARELGCHTMLTATGEAVPGEPQPSYRNILRFGFKENGLRENWAPKPTG